MENIFGLVVFLVFVISAIARMVQGSKQGAANPPRGQKPLTRDMLPEATRRKLYGDDGGDSGPRMATPKQVQPRTATPVAREAPQRREEPLAPGRQLLDALSGRAQSAEEDEWTPAQPAPRHEIPRAVQPPPPPPLPQERVAQQPRPVPQAPPRVAARQEQEQRPRRRERSSQRTAQVRQVQPQRQRAPRRTRQAPAKRAVSHRRGPSSVLFGGLGDVRKAIVFAEILGPPKSMQ